MRPLWSSSTSVALAERTLYVDAGREASLAELGTGKVFATGTCQVGQWQGSTANKACLDVRDVAM